MPGGPIAWKLLGTGAALALGAGAGLRLAARRFRGGDDSSLSPIAALGAGLMVLVGLGVMFVSLDLWGNLGR